MRTAFSVTNGVLAAISNPHSFFGSLQEEPTIERTETVEDENLCDGCGDEQAVPKYGYNLCQACQAEFDEES